MTLRPILIPALLLALAGAASAEPGPADWPGTPLPLPEEIPVATPEPSLIPTPTPSPVPSPSATPKPWHRPVSGVLMNPFGYSYAFYGMLRSGHTGVDLAAPVGSPVYAVDDAVVAKVWTKPNMRYGNYLVLRHDRAPYHSLYGHLSQILVKPGQRIKAGARIATSGESGLASYPHVHFEVMDRVPPYDGAWGYRYICARGTAWIQLRNGKRLGQVAGLTWLSQHIGFIGTPRLEVHSILRMHEHQCLEQAIAPLTYFNPQPLLPAYATGPMPDFSGGRTGD